MSSQPPKRCTKDGAECAGFRKLVKVKAIHEASGQMMLGTGKLINYAYYWLGPARKPGEGMMAVYCPCCGGEVGLTAKFMADMEAREKAEANP